MKKCKVDKKNGTLVSTCLGLTECLEDPYSHTKGINTIELTNFDTGKTRSVLLIRSGKHTKKGLCCNFCPWCGVKMEPVPEQRKSTP